jgi:hypothetical protein
MTIAVKPLVKERTPEQLESRRRRRQRRRWWRRQRSAPAKPHNNGAQMPRCLGSSRGKLHGSRPRNGSHESRKNNTGRISGPFVPMIKATIKEPAWIALSHGARSLYVALKCHYNSTIGNAVYRSARICAKEIGSNKDYVTRWFRELQFYGFIVMVSPGHLGVDGRGKAPHWRLTEEWYHDEPPTRDYQRWNGEKFHEQKSPKYYLRKKQNPVPQTGDGVSPKLGTVASLKLGTYSRNRRRLRPAKLLDPACDPLLGPVAVR